MHEMPGLFTFVKWFPLVMTERQRNEGTIKMEYKGEPLPEKIPWEGEFTLRSDP